VTHPPFCATGELLAALDGDTATLLVIKLKE
jgi:hypothetical protein